MLQPNRNGGEYRYGYQGSEMDNETKGKGNSYTTHFRQLDPRLGRWLSIDPKQKASPWSSPYISMENSLIIANDPNGDIVPVVIAGAVFIYAAVVASVIVYANKDEIGEASYNAMRDLMNLFIPEAPPQVVVPEVEAATAVKKLLEELEIPSEKPDGDGSPSSKPDKLPRLNFDTDTDTDTKTKKGNTFYVTYTRKIKNKDGTVTVYSGRTSGIYYGERPTRLDAQKAVNARNGKSHHKTIEGYKNAIVDKFSRSKSSIRGREQQLIDYYGGAQSHGGTSGNAIRGVGKENKRGLYYHNRASTRFGQLHEYTGGITKPTI